MHKKSLIVLLVMSNAVFAQINVTNSNSEQCSFSWNLDKYTVSSFKNKGTEVSSIHFQGENIILGENGEAVIPAKSAIMGVPAEGEIAIRFTALETKTVQLRAPLVTHEFKGPPRQPGLKYLDQWIVAPQYSSIQNIRTTLLIIRPFIYDPTNNSLKILIKGEGTVSFPKSGQQFYSSSVLKESEFDKVLQKTMINYDIASKWRKPKVLGKKLIEPYPLQQNQDVYSFKVGDGRSGINEATTYENRLVTINADTILKLFGPVSISSVRLYASVKGELPEDLFEDSIVPSGIVEIPLHRVDLNRNGIVDEGDYFIAHVTGASDWMLQPYQNEYEMSLDKYDDYRRYMLCISNASTGLSSHAYTSYSGIGDTLHNFENKIRFKTSQYQPKNSVGTLTWVWARINSALNTFTLQMDVPDVDTTEPGDIRINFLFGSSFDAFLGGDTIFKDGYQVNNEIKKWGNKYLTIKYTGSSDGSEIELSDIDVTYKRLLVAGPSAYTEVYSSPDSGLYFYNLKIATNELIYIFRVSQDEHDFALIDTVRNFQNRNVIWSDSGATGARYIICSEKAIMPLPELNKRTHSSGNFIIPNLRSLNDSTDYLIITNKLFISAAQKLAAHKKNIGFSSPKIAVLDDIYQAFSGGDIDPAAIRNFIMYVKKNWIAGERLCYVILFGAGHYDYKNITTNEPVYMPIHYDGSKITEDFYIKHASSGGFYQNPQLALGRVPCKSESDALVAVNKIIQTEDHRESDFSDWRNRALFVADDDMQGYKEDNVSKVSPHHVSSDNVAQIIENQCPSMQMNKVYLFDYKWNNAREKPDASRAVINYINNGIAYVNYFGHGADQFWADERLLVPDDIQQMNNKGRYPVVSSFSCSVGEFDKPGVVCFSAAMVLAPNAGAIATISSNREAYAGANEALATAFYSNLFPDTSYGVSIGLALISAKIQNTNSNDATYSILGDPSINFIRPVNRIRLQICNSSNTPIDTIKALQLITIKGTITDRNGTTISSADANSNESYIQIGLYNSRDTASRKDGGVDDKVRYIMPGKPVYTGKVKIINGSFSQTLLVSKSLSFDRPGVKLTGYCWNEKNNIVAIGTNSNTIIFHGFESNYLGADTVGPQIILSPLYDYSNFKLKSSLKDGILVIDSLKCAIEVFDENGIDATGTGPDEGLTMEIYGAVNKQNINHKFQFKDGDYRTGSAIIREAELVPGTYKMLVTARDLVGNISNKTFDIEITKQSDLSIGNVFNSPNPMRMGQGTRFYFYSSNTAHYVHATIKIYSLSGKPLRVIHIPNVNDGEYWDGRDQAGNLLGPNIYLYRITLNSPELKKTVTSKIGKIVIHPPR